MSEHVSHEADCSKGNIEQQISQKRAGRRKLVNHHGTLCSGCYQEPPLPGQRYGRTCKNRAALASYHRKQEELRRLKALVEQQKLSKGTDNEHDEGQGCGSAPG